jgi:branched-chain amino acid transport system permease protein
LASAVEAELIFFGIEFCTLLAISLTLNIEFGMTGIPNFGKVLFVAAGGMLGASVMYRLSLVAFNLHSNDIFESSPLYVAIHINPGLAKDPLLAAGLFAFTILFGGAVAAALGFLASYPAIRLREDYLGMLLLGCGSLFSVLTAYYSPINGGPENMTAPNLLAGLGENDSLAMLAIIAVFAVGVFLYAQRVAKSPLGRVLRAVRDNENASEALGKDNVNIRRKALVVSSFLAGVAGALWAINWSVSIGGLIGGDVGGTFPRLLWTFLPFTIVILGGAANNYGVLLGAFLLTTVQTLTVESIPSVLLNVSIKGVNVNLLGDVINSLQYLVVGALLLVVLILRPDGILREKPVYALPKDQLRQIASNVSGQSDAKKKAES